MNPGGNGGSGGQDSPMKISTNFIHCYPLKKSNFASAWHGSLSRWLPFEHSGTKMGSLDIYSVYSTLCPSITSTYMFHIKIPLQRVSIQRMRCRHARCNYLRQALYIFRRFFASCTFLPDVYDDFMPVACCARYNGCDCHMHVPCVYFDAVSRVCACGPYVWT